MITKLYIFITFTFIFTQTSTRYIYNSYELKDLFTQTISDTESYWNLAGVWFLMGGHYLGCGAYYYGGFIVGGSYTSTTYSSVQLPPHNLVAFSVSFVLNGHWLNSDAIYLIVGGQTFGWSSGYNPFWDFRCCTCWDVQIKGTAVHSGSTIGVTMQVASTIFGSAGLRRVSLRFANSSSPANTYCATSTVFPAMGYPIAQCPCPRGQFGSPCTPCDASCEECYGPTAADCAMCNFGYYHDGTQCQPCSLNCTDCGTCFMCSELNFFMDHACIPECNLPFLQSISGDYRFCLSPCKKDTEIVYKDGSCRPTCELPLVLKQISSYTRLVCDLPCLPTETTVWNGTNYTCTNEPCSFPLKDVIYGGALKVCEYPCNITTEVYYSNNDTCQSTCNFPFTLKMYGTVPICEMPCSPTQYYGSWDLTCRDDCPPMLQKEFMDGVWVCYPPECGAHYCAVCGPAPLNQCQDYYFCNTTVARFCEPYYKYQLKVEPIRPVVNGYTFLVQVDPLLGIVPGIEDYLNLSIVGFQVQTDYNYTIDKTSTGTFNVEILIQRPVNSTGMNAFFAYGGGFSNYYILPRLTYVDESTQVAAKNVNTGSQLTFLLFAISIIGCVLGGGMSAIWTAMPESQYAYYLLYLNVDFLHQTQDYFESLSNYDVLISGGDDEEGDHLDLSFRKILPRKFFILDYSPDFLGNTGQIFEQTVSVIVGLIISAIAIRYIRFSGRGMWILRLLMWIRNGFMWNMLIRQMLTYALPLYIACFIQIYSAIFSGTAYFPSMILAVLTMLFFFVFFLKMLSLINNIPKNKYAMVIYDRKFGTLWEDLDVSVRGKYYYWLVAVRGCVLAYLVVFVSLYPYVQVISIALYQGCIVSLFLRKWGIRKVFEDPLLNRVTMIEEISLLLIKMMILVYMVMTMYVGDETLLLMGWLIVIPGAVSQIIQTLYSTGIQIHEKMRNLKALQAALEKKKLKRSKKIRRINKTKHNHNPTRQTINTDIDLNSATNTTI